MGPKDTDNDNVESENNNATVIAESTDSEHNESQPKPKGNEQSQKTYTETEYKGLQTVIAKRDQTIAKLTNENQELQNKLAEAEANHGSAVSEKTNLSQELAEKNKRLSDLESQVAKLQKENQFKDILMKDFPDLGPAASFIPDVETEEEFRQKAKELQSVVGQYSKRKVAETLSGASPPLESNEERTTPGVDPVDEAYEKAMKYAGDPTKVKEYNDAYNKYLDLLDARKN